MSRPTFSHNLTSRVVGDLPLISGILLVMLLLFVQQAPHSQAADNTPTSARIAVLSTNTPAPTRTPLPTRTPTDTATSPPTMEIMGTYTTPPVAPATPIPPMAPIPPASGHDILTVLVMGSDTITDIHETASRTDVMVLLAIDRTAQTVTMMHIPRDMYVYVPNYTMMKINTVVNFGNLKISPDAGEKLLHDTILYNYGVDVNFYARVNFVGFQKIIGQLGGLDISVDCAIQGNRLKDPKLDYTKVDSYELYTMPIGHEHLNGYMALWYARSRGSSSDLDRGRRQMDILRAIWHQAKDAGLISQITTLWPEAQQLVDTNMTLADILGLSPIALSVNPNAIQRIDLVEGTHFRTWFTTNDGEFVLLPNPDAMAAAINDLMSPIPANRLSSENPTVEVGAAPALKGYDIVAADDLSWQGFNSKISSANFVKRDETIVYDYTGGSKPSSLQTLIKTLRISKHEVVDQPDPNSSVDFHVEMGASYGRSCLYKLPDLPKTATQ